MLNTLIAFALAIVSLAVCLYVGALLWNAVAVPLRPRFERRRLARFVARAQRGDRYLRDGAFRRALTEFSAAFYPYPTTTATLTQAVINHHIGLMSRLIATAEHRDTERLRLMSLAKTDKLFQERNVLQRRYLTVRQSGSRQRRTEIERELHANAKQLRAALASLPAEIVATHVPARYH